MTTDQVHYVQADTVHDARQHVLNLACAANPERLVRKSLNPPTNLTPSGSTRRFRNWKAGNKSGHAAAANLKIAAVTRLQGALDLSWIGPDRAIASTWAERAHSQ